MTCSALCDFCLLQASIASRLTRWKLLAESGQEWRLIQTEAALRWVMGSHALMADQLDRIIEAIRLPNVRLGIITLDTVSSQVAPLHSFHIYDDDSVTFGTEAGTALLSLTRSVWLAWPPPSASSNTWRSTMTLPVVSGTPRRRLPPTGVVGPLTSLLQCNNVV